MSRPFFVGACHEFSLSVGDLRSDVGTGQKNGTMAKTFQDYR